MAEVPEVFNELKDAIVQAFVPLKEQTIALAPRLLVMVAVLVVGYIVARILALVFTKLSAGFGLQVAAERSGLAESMRHMGIRRNVPAIIGTIVFWLMMCVFLMAAFRVVGMPDEIAKPMSKVVAFIPSLLVATVVIVVGLLVASFLRGVIATSADRVGITYAERLANGCYYALALLTFILAFNQLEGVAKFELINWLILIVFAGLALGYGLALGLGGRDVMAGILAGYYLRQRLAAGDQVEVAGMKGTVREVGPVATVLETEEDGLLNRHTVPNIKMLNEAVR